MWNRPFLRPESAPSPVVRRPREAEWTIEEAAQAVDPILARFYHRLDSGDRVLLRNWHIDIHGDTRAADGLLTLLVDSPWMPYPEMT
jgi:hypothetical protein